jgi:hypothetical protein
VGPTPSELLRITLPEGECIEKREAPEGAPYPRYAPRQKLFSSRSGERIFLWITDPYCFISAHKAINA